MVLVLVSTSAAFAQDDSFTRTADVIYGRKHGVALTLDVFQPTENPNGAGVIFVVSGGWFSSHEMIRAHVPRAFIERGYTVFAVVHGSQPKYTIPEIIEDMHRSVRFIRQHAEEYGVDADRLGIYGGSAGGHLSLIIGMAGRPGDSNAKDPVDRRSSRVQAVACFFPPTDFLNYGEEGRVQLGTEELTRFRAPFDFDELDPKTGRYVVITEEAKRQEIGKEISPATHVTEDDPPTLIIHGDADKLVPIQQAERIVEKLQEAGVEAKLIVREGAGHGWPKIQDDLKLMADWFDEHLVKEQE
ncbi:MAG: prolyl oligopeptidase family serine peptidase [Planctomycetaceae bacterium]